MIVLCNRDYPTEEEIARRGKDFYRRQAFHISIGREYLVLGVSFFANSRLYGPGCVLLVEDDYGHPAMAPASLFTLVDDRVSPHWVGWLLEDGSFQLLPPSFKGEYFFERLADSEPLEKAEYE